MDSPNFEDFHAQLDQANTANTRILILGFLFKNKIEQISNLKIQPNWHNC